MYRLYFSYLYEPEGNACSLTDSTAEEHVLALVEHSADEARDRINRYMPSSKVIQQILYESAHVTLLHMYNNSST